MRLDNDVYSLCVGISGSVSGIGFQGMDSSGAVAGGDCDGGADVLDWYWVGWLCTEEASSANGHAVAVGKGVSVHNTFFGVALGAWGAGVMLGLPSW